MAVHDVDSWAPVGWEPSDPGFDEEPFGSVLGDPLMGSPLYDVSVIDTVPDVLEDPARQGRSAPEASRDADGLGPGAGPVPDRPQEPRRPQAQVTPGPRPAGPPVVPSGYGLVPGPVQRPRSQPVPGPFPPVQARPGPSPSAPFLRLQARPGPFPPAPVRAASRAALPRPVPGGGPASSILSRATPYIGWIVLLAIILVANALD